MRAALIAASLLASTAFAQRQTIVDPTGNSIIVSIATDADGDPTRTRTLSTITAAATEVELTTTAKTTATATRKTANKGIEGAPPPTGNPMTATVYYYPDPNDPTAPWITGYWENSYVPITTATGSVASGNIPDFQQYQSGLAAGASDKGAQGAAVLGSNSAQTAGVGAAVFAAAAVGAGLAMFL